MSMDKYFFRVLIHVIAITMLPGLLLPGASLQSSYPRQALSRVSPSSAVKAMLLVSVASDASQGNGDSSSPSISADGRYVVFHSDANNLVPGDTNGAADIFLHDRQTGATAIVSVASDGTQGNSTSKDPVISADGRYVAFWSYASNLVSGDTNFLGDVFVHDMQSGETRRVSVTSSGGQSCGDRPSISADGHYVAFQSICTNLVPNDTNNWSDVFVHNTETGVTEIVSIASDGAQGNYDSSSPVISVDGRFVVFESVSNNLVPADTNAVKDIFVRDRQEGVTERVSVASDGAQSNDSCGYSACSVSISADGRYVAFHSLATNLVAADTNGWTDVFVRDRQAGETTRVSLGMDGAQGNDASMNPFISADGRFVAFESFASNLVLGDSGYYYDVFVYDRQAGTTTRVSTNTAGVEGNGYSRSPRISADSQWIAFRSGASNLVSTDTNGMQDIFEAQWVPQGPVTRTFLPVVVK